MVLVVGHNCPMDVQQVGEAELLLDQKLLWGKCVAVWNATEARRGKVGHEPGQSPRMIKRFIARRAPNLVESDASRNKSLIVGRKGQPVQSLFLREGGDFSK